MTFLRCTGSHIDQSQCPCVQMQSINLRCPSSREPGKSTEIKAKSRRSLGDGLCSFWSVDSCSVLFFFKIRSAMSFSKKPPFMLGILLIWLGVTGWGFYWLGAYHARPGRPGSPPVRWPRDCPIPLDPARPTLLIFLHPRCPCSRASVAELAAVSALQRDRFAVHAILYRPVEPSEGWNRPLSGGDGDDSATIPSLGRWSDAGGRLGRRFGVETSGHVLLFNPAGVLVFSGGITPSRGHRGDNLGLDALLERIEGKQATLERSPVFGCPTINPGRSVTAELTQ